MHPLRGAVVVAVVISFLLSITFYCNYNEILRLLIVYSMRRKDAFRSSGAPISLGGAAFSFGCRFGNKKKKFQGGVDDKTGRLNIGKSCWNLELSHLHIGNAPRHDDDDGDTKGDDWPSPYALHLNSMRLSVSGPVAFLSLLQLPVASSTLFGSSASIPRIFCNGLDFVVGFRVRSIDTLKIEGLTFFYIDEGDTRVDLEDQQQLGVEESIVTSGLLELKRGTNRQRRFEFVLKPPTLSWFEFKKGLSFEEEQHYLTADMLDIIQPNKQNPKMLLRGSMKLFPSSSVEVLDDNLLGLELISDNICLVLYASSVEERDAWVDSLNQVIATLQHDHSGGRYGNAPWLEALVAESNARRLRWRRQERRQRREWQRKWQSHRSGQRYTEDNDERYVGGDNDDQEAENEDDYNYTGGEEGVNSNDFLTGIRHALEGWGSNIKTKHFEDALEWRIGHLELKELALHSNDRTHLWLDENGWVLRGFVGSSNELKRRLRFGLGPKLLRDGTGHAIKTGVSEYTGKEDYVFGDLTKATVTKIGAGVADAVHDFTGKEQYEFGDLTKAAVTKVGAGVSDAVHDFTGKEQYEFGDLTKAAVTKVGVGVADAVHDFTGKEQYEFGDVTKTLISKIRRGKSNHKDGQKRLESQQKEEL